MRLRVADVATTLGVREIVEIQQKKTETPQRSDIPPTLHDIDHSDLGSAFNDVMLLLRPLAIFDDSSELLLGHLDSLLSLVRTKHGDDVIPIILFRLDEWLRLDVLRIDSLLLQSCDIDPWLHVHCDFHGKNPRFNCSWQPLLSQ